MYFDIYKLELVKTYESLPALYHLPMNLYHLPMNMNLFVAKLCYSQLGLLIQIEKISTA